MLAPRLALSGLLLALVAAASPSTTDMSFLPSDRADTWAPGLSSVGGVPARTTVFKTVQASTYGNGASDATAGIQAAINACPAGQVVQLSAGKFTINAGNIIFVNKGITLRGAGAGQTILQKTDGATLNSPNPGPHPSPLVIVGTTEWDNGGQGSTNLTADAAKGASSVTVASAAGFQAGQIVLLDELSGAQWMTDPLGYGKIWASPDWRVVWELHNPAQPNIDDPLNLPPGSQQDAFSWFCRTDRPTCETKEIASVSGNTITFTTPIHISYRVSHTAQLSTYGNNTFVKNAGVELLTITGGDDGNLWFNWTAYSWAKNVEITAWLGEGIGVNHSFRVEVRDSYIHDADWPVPGGGGYAISLANGSAEILVENCISIRANKNMVARCCGAASVFGYNYTDDAYDGGVAAWQEIGLNASHMVGPHHVLFEGNYGFNWDSDHTHGNAICHTIFRNWLRGVRRTFTDITDNQTWTDTVADGAAPLRCGGATAYSYWHSFIGNVMGAQGQMTGFVYDNSLNNGPNAMIWFLGWDSNSPNPSDPAVASSTIRDGNWDWVTSSKKWQNTPFTIPPSLYLMGKPAFFGTNTWPWVDPSSGTAYTLPAKARYDAGTPNLVTYGPPPTVATAAAASPNPVLAKTTSLSVLGAYSTYGEASLTYTWSASGPATVTFSPNATNAAKNSTATFSMEGAYTLTATLKNSGGGSATSSANVTVDQTLTAARLSPSSASVVLDGTKQFTATAEDQFGKPMGTQPTFVWSVSGGGTISAAGLFTASGTAGGPFTVTAMGGGESATAQVTVTSSTPVLSTVRVSPSSATVAPSGTQTFTAVGVDQFGNPISPPPTFAWHVSGGGSITAAGGFTAGATPGGPFTATASSGSVSGTALVTVAVSASPPGGGGSGGGGGGGCGLIGLEGFILMLLATRLRSR